MPKENSPAFQFYPREFLQDEHVACMTLEERGAYITLLCSCWTEQSIPCDVKRLSRLLGVSTRKARALWEVLSDRFSEPVAGRCTHKRLEHERDKQAEFRRRQSDRGRRSAEARWGNREVTGVTDPVEPTRGQPLGDCRQETGDPGEGGVGGEGDVSDRAGEFCRWYRWDAYPKARGVPYTPSAMVERSDLDSATRLAVSYTDADMRRIAEFFLSIPDDREKFIRGKQRTVSMLLTMAGPIVERLKSA